MVYSKEIKAKAKAAKGMPFVMAVGDFELIGVVPQKKAIELIAFMEKLREELEADKAKAEVAEAVVQSKAE